MMYSVSRNQRTSCSSTRYILLASFSLDFLQLQGIDVQFPPCCPLWSISGTQMWPLNVLFPIVEGLAPLINGSTLLVFCGRLKKCCCPSLRLFISILLDTLMEELYFTLKLKGPLAIPSSGPLSLSSLTGTLSFQEGAPLANIRQHKKSFVPLVQSF